MIKVAINFQDLAPIKEFLKDLGVSSENLEKVPNNCYYYQKEGSVTIMIPNDENGFQENSNNPFGMLLAKILYDCKLDKDKYSEELLNVVTKHNMFDMN